mmetsp:Transcript_26463/g.48712  ORF Transcript_26463/g.48712 Transcript_26463/m.48712 type:complete len:253 (-) Transcript_26463:79-837(-)
MSVGAFGALFSTVPLEDGSYTKLPSHAPPGPRPRARIPMKTRGLRSDCSSKVSTPNGTPSSNASTPFINPRTSPKTVLARAAAKSAQAQTSAPAPESSSSTPADSQPASSRPFLMKVVPFSTPANIFDPGGMCCFREEKGKSFRACDPILEDRPEVEFKKDISALELQSVFRRHNIEPSDSLIRDMLHWQARAVRDEPPSCVMSQNECSNKHPWFGPGCCCCCCCRDSAHTLMGRASVDEYEVTDGIATQHM